MSERKSGFVELEGARFWYELTGKGETLVLLHGFSFDSTLWDDQIDAFAVKHRVLRYDLRGFGKTTSADVTYAHASDLKALLDFLNIESVYLLGLSLGGGAAINFALSYPGRARALIVAAPSLGGFNWSETMRNAQNSLTAIAREQGVEKARALWLRQTIFQLARGKPHVAQKLRQMVNRYSGWHWLHADLGRPLIPPAIERLKDIRVPTLLIVGDSDAPDQLRIVDTLQPQLDGAQKIIFRGVGHAVNLEAPEQFNAAVLEFLDGLDSPRS
jgi:3-oxoadipate enol-lactonase